MNYQRDQKFIHPENWKDIKRGWIHEAVVPFTAERPLDFFIEDEKNPKYGKIESGFGVFKPSILHKAVVELKQRKVLILSNDEICQATDVYDITVAPIYGIYSDDKQKDWYKQVVNNDHPFFAYLPEEVTGKECLIDLTNVISISKNMLLKDKIDISDKMDHIENVLERCLQLGLYKKSVSISEEIS